MENNQLVLCISQGMKKLTCIIMCYFVLFQASTLRNWKKSIISPQMAIEEDFKYGRLWQNSLFFSFAYLESILVNMIFYNQENTCMDCVNYRYVQSIGISVWLQVAFLTKK